MASRRQAESNAINSPWITRRGIEAQVRQEKVDAVIRVAAIAFAEKGFERTSMGDIAKDLGVTKPTLYNYFPSKAALLNACHRKAIGRFAAAAKEAAEHGGTGVSKLQLYLTRALEYSTDDLGRAFVLLDDRDLDATIRKAFAKLRAEIEAEILGFVRQAISAGDISPTYDDKLVAVAIVASFNTIPIWYKSSGPMTVGKIADQYLRMFFDGLTPRSPEQNSRR